MHQLAQVAVDHQFGSESVWVMYELEAAPSNCGGCGGDCGGGSSAFFLACKD